MVFGDLTFSIGMKYNMKQLERSSLLQSSSSVPTHYLNNWNLSEEIQFYYSEKILPDPEKLSQPGNMLISALVNSRGIMLRLVEKKKNVYQAKGTFVVQKLGQKELLMQFSNQFLKNCQCLPSMLVSYNTMNMGCHQQEGDQRLVRVLMTLWRQYQT